MNWYDMNLRMYDPALARWMVQDPVIHYTKSTYNAFDNNPVYFADPSGATTEGSNDGGNGGGIESVQLGFGVTLANIAGVGLIESTAAPGYGGNKATSRRGSVNSTSPIKGETNDSEDLDKPLKGGKYDNRKFDDIKEEDSPYYSLSKKTLTSKEWSNYVEETEKSMDKTGNGMKKAGAFFGGTSGLKLKDIKNPITFFKSFSITTILATTVIIQGKEITSNASALRDIGYNYNKTNIGKIGEGVYIINVRNSAPAFGGTGSNNYYIYDKGTNQYLGSYKN